MLKSYSQINKRYKIVYSDQVQDLICRLLIKKKENRLGSINGAEEILEHEWFADVDIDEIKNKTIIPPFTPALSDESDTKYYKMGRAGINMADTVIPQEKIEEVKLFSDQFEDFEKKSKRKM